MLEEFKNTSLNDYNMKPTIMTNGLLIYPINIYDYEFFSMLANQYIVLDIYSKNNLYRQDFLEKRKKGLIPRSQKYKPLQYQNLFDLIIALINQDEKVRYIKENKSQIEQLKELHKDDIELTQIIQYSENANYENILGNFSYLLYMTTKIKPQFDGNNFIFVNEEKQFILNCDNFYEFREIVMKQNVLHEPRIAPNKESQEYIDSEIKSKFGNEEFDLEAMVAFVSANCGIDVSKYTYYRLKADYEAKMREISYLGVSIYRANGCKTAGDKDIPYPNILEHFAFKDNPYGKESFYKNSEETEFDKTLKRSQ